MLCLRRQAGKPRLFPTQPRTSLRFEAVPANSIRPWRFDACEVRGQAVVGHSVDFNERPQCERTLLRTGFEGIRVPGP